MTTAVMGDKIKVFWWLCLLGLTTAELIIEGEWKEYFGAEVTCSWETMPNDTLQSIKMYRNDVQFLQYRPEINGPVFSEQSRPDQYLINSRCTLLSSDGKRGKCVVKLEPCQNATEDTYKCETSGERPTFRLETKEYTVFSPPRAAVLKQIETETALNHVLRPTMNCTSSGLPPPRLLWKVEGQMIPEDFTHTKWNSTTKLWDSWSSYNPQKYNVIVVCTPEATTKFGRVHGTPAQWVVTYNSGPSDAPKVVVLVFLMLALLLR